MAKIRLIKVLPRKADQSGGRFTHTDNSNLHGPSSSKSVIEENTQVSPPATVLVRKPPKSFRWLIWSLPFVGVVIPSALIAWSYFGPAERIRISTKTTRLLKPISTTGYVDYVAHFRKLHEDLGGKPHTEDPWGALVRGLAVRSYLPDPSIAGMPDTQSIEELAKLAEEFAAVSKSIERPWTTAQFPRLATAIKKSEAWYDEAIETMEPVVALDFSHSDDRPLVQMYAPSLVDSRGIARTFRMRTMMNVGLGNGEAVLADLQFLFKMANRKNVSAISGWHHDGYEANALRSLMISALSMKQISPDFHKWVDTLPVPSLPKKLHERVEAARLQELDTLTRMHSAGIISADSFSGSPKLNFGQRRRLYSNLDWNQALIQENELFDEVQKALSLNSWIETNSRIQLLCDNSTAWQAQIRITQTSLKSSPVSTADFIMARQRHFILPEAVTFVVATQSVRRVAQLIVRLAVWKQLAGEFPDDLQQLNSLSQFVRQSGDFDLDPFSGSEFIYQRTKDGFEIRCVGVNGVRDKEVCYALEYDGYAFSHKRAKTDIVWRWPIQYPEANENLTQ